MAPVCKSDPNTVKHMFGIAVRYPNELAVDDSIAGQAINYAEKVLTFCETVISGMGQEQVS